MEAINIFSQTFYRLVTKFTNKYLLSFWNWDETPDRWILDVVKRFGVYFVNTDKRMYFRSQKIISSIYKIKLFSGDNSYLRRIKRA